MLLHEIFATCLFHDFDVRIFRDTWISRFCENLIFWITLISCFEHHNLNFMGNNVKIAKHNSGTKCQLYNKAVFTTSTSSSYLYVNFCRYYIRKKGLNLKVQCYFYILSFSVKNRNNTDPSPHVSLKVKTEVKPVQVIYVCIYDFAILTGSPFDEDKQTSHLKEGRFSL